MVALSLKVLVAVPRGLFALISRPEDEAKLRSFAEVEFNPYDRDLTEHELSELIADVDGCITSWGSPKFTVKVLDRARRLRIIGHAAGSVKPYITEEVFRRGIVVTNAASTIAKSVAEFTLAQILNCLRGIQRHSEAMRRGDWGYRDRKGFTTIDLRGKRVGLLGFGHVARELTKLLRPFEVDLVVYDPYVGEGELSSHGARGVDIKELLSTSDVVSLHLASTPETRHMLGEAELRAMKPTAYLVNTSRGAVVDEAALVTALREGRIAGAALDVFEEEPLPDGSPLYELDNVILTPHIAGPSDEMRRTLFGTVVKDFRRFFSGERPLNEVKYGSLRYSA